MLNFKLSKIEVNNNIPDSLKDSYDSFMNVRNMIDNAEGPEIIGEAKSSEMNQCDSIENS